MKQETAEKLINSRIIASRGENLRCLAGTVLWIGIFAVMNVYNHWVNIGRIEENGVFFGIGMGLWFLCPMIFGRKIIAVMFRAIPGFYGSIFWVLIAIVFCLWLALAAGFFGGLVLILLKGVIRPVYSFIAMAVYNSRINKINAISGDVTPYLEDTKFLKRIDNISETIDIFRELKWISEEKYERFAEQYNMFMGFLAAREEYEQQKSAAL
ncbi:MAG: hypothetical protein K2N72_04550 [Oscillospiraceae bacterium]|nr:hypothetical protein [Oscillospiraceae bacterium]